MPKKVIISIVGIAIIGAMFLILKNGNKPTEAQSQNNQNSLSQTKEEKQPAEKVQVYLFHSTNRCYSCITMGQYAKATVEEFFQPELRDGKIEFKEINVDLPENKEVVTKFKAVGTSLFINAIIDGKDNIQEEVQAWRLLGNKTALSDYLSKKISSLF